MKKYRLLKWYPSLPVEWKQYKEVVVVQTESLRYIFKGYYNCTSEIEGNPDYWEEIKDKPKYKIIKSCPIDGSIYAVDRLSDGVIFEIGDYILCENSHVTNPEKITGIGKNNFDNIILFTSSFHNNGVSIHKAKICLPKSPLLITEDGVKYFNDNDLVWDTHNFESNDPAISVNPYFLEQTEVKYARNIGRKFFSTKSAAENYRKCHIRCLSFNDVWNISTNKDSNNCYVIIGKSDLTQLVKERMPK